MSALNGPLTVASFSVKNIHRDRPADAKLFAIDKCRGIGIEPSQIRRLDLEVDYVVTKGDEESIRWVAIVEALV